MSDIPLTEPSELPVLPLRDVVVYPHMVIPLFVGREKSMRALDVAMERDKRILLVAQTSPEVDDPGAADLYQMGTVAQVLQLLKLPDGTIKVLVEGISRARVADCAEREGALSATAMPVQSTSEREERELEVTLRSLLSLFEQYVKMNRKIPPELLSTLGGIDDPSRLADTIAAHLAIRLSDKQTLLENLEVGARLEQLIGFVDGEIDVQQLEKRIRGRVKSQMEKSQREYYLNEQMKAIQKELGDLDEQPNEQEDLARKIAEAKMPKAVETKAKAELNKLKQMSPMSAEATVVRNYIDWLVGVPWSKRSKVRRDLKQAQDVLDADHYGLEKVKERILEYLAVQARVRQMKGPILCLVGPPGVGKTSLGQSIAKATNRKFVRMSLGGVRDEAEIRGHRQLAQHPRPAAGPHGSDPHPRLYRGREDRDRHQLPAAQADQGQRAQARGNQSRDRGDPRDRALLHARIRGAWAGAGNLQDLPQGGHADRTGRTEAGAQGTPQGDRHPHHAGQYRHLSGRAPLRLRSCRRAGRSRSGHRPGLDRSRR